MSSLPPIPKDWSLEKCQRELQRVKEYIEHTKGSMGRHYYDSLKEQLEENIKKKEKGMQQSQAVPEAAPLIPPGVWI